MDTFTYYGYLHGSLIKTDSLGNIIFFKGYYPSANHNYDTYFDGMETTSDNSFLVIGDFEQPPGVDRVLMKINQDGDMLWAKSFGFGETGGDKDALVKTADNRFVLKTGPASSSFDDFVLSKIDKDGFFFYSIRIRDSANTSININHTRLTIGNGIILGGHRGTSAILIRTDSLFNPIFSVKYPNYYEIVDVQPTADDGFITVIHDSVSYESSFTVMKTGPSGTPLWATSFTDTSKSIFSAVVFENTDQTYYCMVNWRNIHSAYFNYDGAIIKLDHYGNVK